jgi:co-chaperonin GroES (HSP10)
MIKPLNSFVLIKVDKPKDKIGSIFLPGSLVIKLNSGYVVDFSDKIKAEIAVGDHVTFMEYAKSMWFDNEHIIVPFESLNSRETVGGELKAVGSKILVVINKEKQASNRFLGSMKKILSVEFNNQFQFNNQFGEVHSVGGDVKESVEVGDVALFSHFVESVEHYLVKKLAGGDEIRVFETGTRFNFEWYGYYSQKSNEWVSNNHYVFTEELKIKKDVVKLQSGLYGLTSNFFDAGNIGEKTEEITCFTVSHTNHVGTIKKGDKLICKGKQAPLSNVGIFYIPSILIVENLNGMIEEKANVTYEKEKVTIELT